MSLRTATEIPSRRRAVPTALCQPGRNRNDLIGGVYRLYGAGVSRGVVRRFIADGVGSNELAVGMPSRCSVTRP